MEVRLLLPALSSSLIPFLRRLDWHCTSVRRPARFRNHSFSRGFVFPGLCTEADVLTLRQHPHRAALPEPAVLALPPHVHVHLAAAAALAAVNGLFGHAAPEETCGGGGHQQLT